LVEDNELFIFDRGV
jgi:hypothetical protein